jgi:hypothetical protein
MKFFQLYGIGGSVEKRMHPYTNINGWGLPSAVNIATVALYFSKYYKNKWGKGEYKQ